MIDRILRVSVLVAVGSATPIWPQIPETLTVRPVLGTTPVNYEAHDPTFWEHPTDPELSLIIGTDIGTYPNGGIFTWNLDGSLQQRVNISHPEHIDIRRGMELGGQRVDIVAVAMRDHAEIRVFKINPETRLLENVTTEGGINVFFQPFGLALYKRPSDGAIFVTVSGRTASSREGVWQLRLEDDGTGRVRGVKVREFGHNKTFVGGMVSDDALGYLYIAEEDSGIHKYYADPDRGSERLAYFARPQDFTGNRAGLALYACGDSTGYLLVANTANNAIQVYRREGDDGDPHKHTLLTTIQNELDKAGDGIAVAHLSGVERFPNGFLIWLNKTGNNFQLYAWEDVAQNFLKICLPEARPTSVGRNGTAPERFALQQNYPNPFNPETEIRFQLPTASRVKLTVFNLLGQKVKVLVNEERPSGFYAVRWKGEDAFGRPVASGVYLYKLEATRYTETRRMILLR